MTRAASALHVSQPPLSRQIRDLEEEIGVNLFERRGRSVKLTRAGRVFLKKSRIVLSRAGEAVRAAQAAAGSGKHEVRIGYVPSLTVNLLPAVLRAFAKKAPGVRVNLHDMTTPAMIAAVRKGRLEGAFVTRHPSDRIRGVTFEPLQFFRVGVMVPKGHPLARKTSVATSDVVAEPFVAFSRKEYAIYHKWLRSLFGGRSRKIRFVEECDGGPSLIAAVESGRGIAVCSEGHIGLAGSRIAFVPFAPAPQPVAIGISYGPGALDSEEARQFIEAARSFKSRMGALGAVNPGGDAKTGVRRRRSRSLAPK